MARAYYSTVLEAEVDRVWETLGSFHGLSRWVAKIVSDEPEEGSGRGPVGSRRRLTLTDGRTVREELVAYDSVDRSYSYQFPAGGNPFPVRSYLATVRVRPVTAAGATFVEWYGDYDSDAAVDEEMRTVFAGRYSEFLGNLKSYLGL